MDDIEKLRGLLAKATPVPWQVGWEHTIATSASIWAEIPLSTGWAEDAFYKDNATDESKANAALIVAAVNAIPALLDEITRLREAVAWQPIETAPAAVSLQDEKIMIIGGAWARPELVLPDGDWWRIRKAEGFLGTPTHWMRIPAGPSTLAGERT